MSEPVTQPTTDRVIDERLKCLIEPLEARTRFEPSLVDISVQQARAALAALREMGRLREGRVVSHSGREGIKVPGTETVISLDFSKVAVHVCADRYENGEWHEETTLLSISRDGIDINPTFAVFGREGWGIALDGGAVRVLPNDEVAEVEGEPPQPELPGELELACAEAIGSFAWSDDWRNEVAAVITRVVAGPLRAEIERLGDDLERQPEWRAHCHDLRSRLTAAEAQRDSVLAACKETAKSIRLASEDEYTYNNCLDHAKELCEAVIARCETGQRGGE